MTSLMLHGTKALHSFHQKKLLSKRLPTGSKPAFRGKKMVPGLNKIPDSVFGFVRTILADFGLTKFNPNLREEAFSVHNSNAFFKLMPDPERLRNDSFLVAAYDSIVHKRFKRMFVKIKDQGGSITEDIANEAIWKRRNRVCYLVISAGEYSLQDRKFAQVRKEFVDANQFPEWFVTLVGNYDLTSDDGDLNNGGYEIKTKFFRSDVWDLTVRSSVLRKMISPKANAPDSSYRSSRGEVKVLPASSSASGTKNATDAVKMNNKVLVYIFSPSVYNSLPPSTRTRLNAEFTSDFNLHYPDFFTEQQQAELANYIQEYKSGDLDAAYNIPMGGEWIDLAEEEESNDEDDDAGEDRRWPSRHRSRTE
ncbi:hypothetical protein BT69DRAFT_1305634 [Atractiella rhizophila]|nr:hypothetical protein BT69DRAFT_1305634 [Atractiella rhizophila]